MGKKITAVKKKVANIVANNLGENRVVVNLNRLEKIPIENRNTIAILLGVDELFESEKYDLLIRLGEIDEFFSRGLEMIFIALYPRHREELGYEMQQKVNSLVSKDMLEAYIENSSSKEFRFFIYHPSGLKLLVKHGLTDFIVAHECEFRKIVDEFQQNLSVLKPSQKEYMLLLESVLI